MYDHVTKTNKLHNTIIGRLMALFVAGVVCLSQAIPAFADDATKTRVDFSTTNLIISTENTMYFTEPNYGDIVVPVYMTFGGSGLSNYYSGYVFADINPFNYVDGNSNRYVISYFEGTKNSIDVTYNKTNGRFTLYFDNSFIEPSVIQPIGYFHLMGNPVGNTLTLTCSNYSQTASIANGSAGSILYTSTYEWGYVNALIYALNNSANVEEMLSILNSIDANMLPEILTIM